MKKIVFFTVAVFLLPLFSQAAPQITPQEKQLQQLQALVSYLERTYNSHMTKPLTANELRQGVQNGVDWLVQAQEFDGHFSYEYAPYDDEYLSGDNIVRQTGALYELGEVLRRQEQPSDEIKNAMQLSIEYFENLSQEDTFLGVTGRCIVEAGSDRCRLGATSLALIGILSYVETYPEDEELYEDLITDYAAHVLNAKQLRYGFRDTHIVGSNGQPSKESAYSNGEALLALVRYNNYKNSAVVSGVIKGSIEYLKEQPFDSALYLWMMTALKDLETEEISEHISFVRDFTNWRISRVAPYKATKKNYCAYAEGIASAYSVLRGTVSTDEELSIRTELDYWNAHNEQLQIGTDDVFRYQIDESGALTLLDIEDRIQAKGGFLTSDDVLTQRIDFTQHCVNASLQTLVDIDGQTL